MGMYSLLYPRPIPETVEQGPNIGRMQRPTLQSAEQLRTPGEAQGPAFLYPTEDDRHRPWVKTYDSPPVSLAV
jgi:hypothetical protein